ncbi:2-phospho-L-lactate transferase [Candidatus Bathyarchaeota archaeon]|nr:MAG: 2-phospho-L-lactate transferase [Candidatus Bathyarchaeota archaeon]
MLVALAGGVGASRLLYGLAKLVPPEKLTIIVNTGDDIEMHGLHISPDVDTVIYMLAGLIEERRGWGIRGDTFHCLEMLGRYGCETWFRLGDKDLATHIYRTMLLKQGTPLSVATEKIRKMLGVEPKIIPMTNDRVETWIITDVGEMHFQEYYVKRRFRDRVLGVVYRGIRDASPAPGVLEALRGAEAVVLCPSNPIVSIGPILALKGVRRTLVECEAEKIAVSPFVGSKPVKGPADRLMEGLGVEPSAYGVAKLYADFLDKFVLDVRDEALRDRIEALGIEVIIADTLMKTPADRIRLARVVLKSITRF